MKRVFFPCLLVFLTLLSSCIGVDSKITIRRDGSGTIELQYRVSEELQALGELDGNEHKPTVPTGRIDFERGAARIDGLSLVSYAEKRQDHDRTYAVTLSFAHMDALMAFLDGFAGEAVLDQNKVSVSLSAGGKLDDELKALAREQLSGYEFRFSVQSALGGRSKNFEYAVPMAELLLAEDPVRLDIEL
ncbi:MAG: hypothetical protein LBH73_04995 [Spirochaetaceae bacterium]|jgi:hypothetical protein|nr:hypothetical protein [Spirochaetaceae bacterium]